MLLNLYFSLFNNIISKFFALVLCLLISNYTECQLTYDVVVSTNLNVFFWDLCYFVWTNVTYIYTLLIPSIVLLFISANSSPNNLYSVLIIVPLIFLLIVYIFTISNDHLNLNHSPLKLDYYNALLINGLNNYHPFILYLVWLFLFILYVYTYYSHVCYKYHCCVNPMILSSLQVYLDWSILTLFLGSWWAQQEGSWGGWWNWDPSEVFGLYIMLLLSGAMHLAISNHTNSYISASVGLLISSTLFYYCFMQLNFSLISHNFGFSDSDLVDIRIFYSVVLVSILISTPSVVKRITQTNNLYSVFAESTDLYAWYSIIGAQILVVTVALSLTLLLNDLLWKLLKVNLTNSTSSYQLMLLVLLYLYLLVTTDYKWSVTLSLVFFICTVNTESLLLPLLSEFMLATYYPLHNLILASLLAALLYAKFITTHWFSLLEGSFVGLPLCTTNSANFYSASYPFIFESGGKSAYTTYLLNTSPEVNLFDLLTSVNTPVQSLLSDQGVNGYSFTSNEGAAIILFSLLILYSILSTRVSNTCNLILV